MAFITIAEENKNSAISCPITITLQYHSNYAGGVGKWVCKGVA